MTKQTKKTNEISNQEVDFSIAEKWNGIAALIGCFAAFASYSFTGQLIPGVV
tara:strand:+ start:140 stop:295 length:156 start_codon:yes stop_codon:yes gene_type:complete